MDLVRVAGAACRHRR
ncbi:hypothetical protein [Nocardia mikamii]